jgi:hypothetical protein
MRLLKDTCRSIRDLLPLHVGGDLDPGPARRVDEHLHHCLSCFREFRELASMRQRLVVLGEQQPPAAALDHFTEEVMARIALGERGPAAELPGVRRARPSVVVPLAAAATLLVGVMLGYVAQTRAPGASPALQPAGADRVLTAAERRIPSEVRGSPVREDLGGMGSPVDRGFIHSPPLRDIELMQLLLNGRREGLSPEPGRQLRLRSPGPPEEAPQDAPQPAPQPDPQDG